MRIDVNLATQKYQDSREFYLRWGVALALVLVLTLGLAFASWRSYKKGSADAKGINAVKEQIAQQEEKKKQDLAVLNRPENQDVREQSQFWNDVIDQKAFSWTQLFSDLEKIMPARAYIVHAAPTITPEKRLQLQLVFVGEKYDDANELLRNMEHSERFRFPVLRVEGPLKIGAGLATQSVIQFEIVTDYTPAAPGQQHAASAKEGA